MLKYVILTIFSGPTRDLDKNSFESQPASLIKVASDTKLVEINISTDEPVSYLSFKGMSLAKPS